MKQAKGTSDYDVAESAFLDNDVHKVYVLMANFFETWIPQIVNDGLDDETRKSIYVEPLLILCAQFSEAIKKYEDKLKDEKNALAGPKGKESESESSLLPLLLAYIKQTRLNDTITETGLKEFTPEMWESLTNLIAQTTKEWDANPEKVKRLIVLLGYNADPEYHKKNLKALQNGFTRKPLARTKWHSVVDQVRSRISTLKDLTREPSVKTNDKPTLVDQVRSRISTILEDRTSKSQVKSDHHPKPFGRSKSVPVEAPLPESATFDKNIRTIVQTYAKGDHIKDLIKGGVLKNAIEAITKDPSYQEMVKQVRDFHNYGAAALTKKVAPPEPDKTTRALVSYVERISQCLEKDDVSSLKKSQIKRCINNMKNNPALMDKLATLGEPKSESRSSRMGGG